MPATTTSRPLIFYGSHGSFTCCPVSGHVIEAEACTCGDCEASGGYAAIALLDVTALPPDVVEHGGGDILGAPLIYRDGGYAPAMGWDEDDDGLGGIFCDMPRLPAPHHFAN